jgi:hypothetical protein
MGGCKCGKQSAATSEDGIETLPIVVTNPDAPAPTVDFPPRWHAKDASLNAFIASALKIAAEGDYEGFRQLFGAAYPPTGRQEFQRVWHAVQDISVAGLYGDRPDPEKYFLHAVVRRRGEDRKGRRKLDVVVMLYRESDRWRLGPATREIEEAILAASTQPASNPAATEARQAPR